MKALTVIPIDFGADFWKSDRKTSGKNIDIFRGQNIPGNSKTIDRTVGLGGMVSHKSTDIRLKSYQNANRVYQLGMHFVRQLARYQGEIRMDHQIGATYNLHWAVGAENASRILEWFIPDSGPSEAVQHALIRVATNAMALNIEVQLYAVKDY